MYFYLNVYIVLIFYKNINFSIIGASCMVYVYFGEFLTPSKRDSYLLFLELFWAFGMMVGPGLYIIYLFTVVYIKNLNTVEVLKKY